MKDLKGKTAFITGGGSGVALGQAKAFSAVGMKVVIVDIRQDHLEDGLAQLRARGAEVHGIKLDITDRKAYAEAANEAERVFGTGATPLQYRRGEPVRPDAAGDL